MADGTVINPGAGGDKIETDELATLNGVDVSSASPRRKVQRVKVGFGSDDDFRDVDPTHGLPIEAGTDADGVAQPTGGVGLRGWLSGIYNRLAALGATGDASSASTVIGLLKWLKAGPVSVDSATLATASKQDTAATKLDTLHTDLGHLTDGTAHTILDAGSALIGKVDRSTVTSATLANVASSATSVQLWASSASAKLRTIFNDSTAILYVKFGTTASTSDYTVRIAAGGYYEFPNPLYTGRVDGIWASANGNARLTEA